MQLEIKSKKLNKTLTFLRPGKSYIFVDLNGRSGTTGNQICNGGSLAGDTLSYSGDDNEVFNRICRKWYKHYIKKLN